MDNSIIRGRSDVEVAEHDLAYKQEQVERLERSLARAKQWRDDAKANLDKVRAESLKPFVPSTCCDKWSGCVCMGGYCPIHGGPGCSTRPYAHD